MITLLLVMQKARLCYYTIITYYYVLLHRVLLLLIITCFNLPNLQMRLPPVLVAARPSDPPKLCRSVAPRARPLILQSKPSIVFWNSLRDSGVIDR